MKWVPEKLFLVRKEKFNLCMMNLIDSNHQVIWFGKQNSTVLEIQKFAGNKNQVYYWRDVTLNG